MKDETTGRVRDDTTSAGNGAPALFEYLMSSALLEIFAFERRLTPVWHDGNDQGYTDRKDRTDSTHDPRTRLSSRLTMPAI